MYVLVETITALIRVEEKIFEAVQSVNNCCAYGVHVRINLGSQLFLMIIKVRTKVYIYFFLQTFGLHLVHVCLGLRHFQFFPFIFVVVV